ncbi:MAG: hypothetical protein QM726_13125 [Chitinophagaceae bacterium]
MKTNKATLGFKQLSDANLEPKVAFIISSMTGNVNYPSPVPTLADVETARKNFSDAVVAAKTKDTTKQAAKKEMRKALEAVLTDLVHYVNFASNGDRVKIISSGMTVNVESRAPVQLGTVENFTAVLGEHSGEIILSVDPVAGAKTYLFLYAQAPVVNDSWMHVMKSSPEAKIENLEPMKQYCLRIGVAGSKDQTVYTSIITKAVV